MREVLGHDIKIENVKYFIRCINKNPITAFGYDIQGKDSKLYNHPHFSKHEVIRALDFWIEHWVYQNQCEAAFTDTVNVDHEITLKELILVREKVMKMPADTKFTRERIKEPITSKGAHNTNYEKVDHNGVRKFYHYDGDDDRVITNMTKAEIISAEKHIGESFKKKGDTKKPKLPEKVVFTQAVYCEDSSLDPFCHMVLELTPEEYIKYKNKPYATGQIKYNFSEELLLGVQNSGGLFTNAMAAAMSSVQGSMEDLATALNGISDVNVSEPWTIIDERAFNDLQDAINLVGMLPSTGADFPIGAPTDEISGMMDSGNHSGGGLGSIIRPQEGPDHLLHSNLHPGIPTITYVNMHSIINGQPIMTDTNSFITIPVTFNGNGAEISTDIFMELGSSIDQITSWNNHRIQIRPGQQNFLEIDGQEYHCVDMNISHNPSMPFSMHLRDLWIESTTSEASGAGTKLEINFQTTMGLTRMNISITLHNPDTLLSNNSALMRQSINQQRAWDLEILGNQRVRIGGDVFVVLEPIQISMH